GRRGRGGGGGDRGGRGGLLGRGRRLFLGGGGGGGASQSGSAGGGRAPPSRTRAPRAALRCRAGAANRAGPDRDRPCPAARPGDSPRPIGRPHASCHQKYSF